jgi:tetratricopeptide (TPR) repeat protein
MRIAHADYYLGLVRRVAPGLRGSGQIGAVAELGLEVPNLRAAARHLVQEDRLDEAGDFAWTLLAYWWISGYFADVSLWMEELLSKRLPVSARTRAIATFFPLWAGLWQRPSDQVVEGLGEAVRLFTESGDAQGAAMALAARASTRLQFPDMDEATVRAELGEAIAKLHELGDSWAESLAEVVLGQLGMVLRDIPAALAHLDRAVEIADDADDAFTRVVAGNNRARLRFLLGDREIAEEEFLLTLTLSIRLHFLDGATYGIEGMCAIAAFRGDAWRAGALGAFAAMIRETTGVYDIEGFAVHLEPLAAVRAADPESTAAGERAGREMTLPEAIAIALPDIDADVRERVPSW